MAGGRLAGSGHFGFSTGQLLVDPIIISGEFQPVDATHAGCWLAVIGLSINSMGLFGYNKWWDRNEHGSIRVYP